jgi:hypothetical protein
VPGEHRVEAIVERRVRVDAVKADAVPELAQPRERAFAGARGEVVEVAPRHQEVRGRGAALGLELREGERRIQRHVDVVAEEEVTGARLVVEEGPAVAAGLGGVEQLAVVREIEGAGHSTSTLTSAAARSERSSASGPVSPTAIT